MEWFSLIIGLLAISAFGADPAGQPVTVTYSAGESEGSSGLGATVDIAQVAMDVGEILDILLSGNPSTGYTWHYNPRPCTSLRYTGREVHELKRRRVGAPGTTEFEFVATAVGKCDLHFSYERSGDSTAGEQAVVHVRVE